MKISATRTESAIADTIVIGVGDPFKATLVAGHSSKQETWSLKQLAARLNGTYHEGNRLQLPSEVLKKLSMISPNAGEPIGTRDAGLLAIGIGSTLTAGIGPLLMLAGLRRPYARERKRANQRGTERVAVSGMGGA